MQVIETIIPYSRSNVFPIYPIGDSHLGTVHCREDLIKAKVREIADIDATISAAPEVALRTPTRTAYGAIEGRIQTVTNRKGLRFNLFDLLNDRAVSCYLEEGREELLREVWGKRAVVEGDITRDSLTGRPLAIRHIISIRVLPEVEKASYLEARAIAPRPSDSPLPEVLIRRLRDAS